MNKRDSRIDIIRLVALACLVIVHYILRTELYQTEVVGTRWIIICVVRSLGMCCIPLFLMVTGYLMGPKKYEKGYYKKITRTLVIYFLASIVISIYKYLFLGEYTNAKGFILRVLNYTGAPYGWYVELYIGLFIMTPLLNHAYQSMDDNGKKRLVVTLFILTGLPSFANVYRIGDLSWWINPSSNSDYFKLVPAWWESIYPLTYYYIGCWIREKKPKISRIQNIILVLGLMSVFGLYNWWRSRYSVFVWGPWQDWGAWMNLSLSVSIFVLLINMNEIKSMRIKETLRVLSNSVFGAYLLSWIAEDIIYSKIIIAQPEIIKRIKYFPLTFCVYICAISMSLCLSGMYALLRIIYYRIKRGSK